MRLGIVVGKVVLSVSTPELQGTTLLIVEPMSHEDLLTGAKRGSGKALVVADQLSPSQGQLIAFVEGPEAAKPYRPNVVPVDAYCSLVVDNLVYKPLTVAEK
jgi:microcompartment protein CcmK/EutM